MSAIIFFNWLLKVTSCIQNNQSDIVAASAGTEFEFMIPGSDDFRKVYTTAS